MEDDEDPIMMTGKGENARLRPLSENVGAECFTLQRYATTDAAGALSPSTSCQDIAKT